MTSSGGVEGRGFLDFLRFFAARVWGKKSYLSKVSSNRI